MKKYIHAPSIFLLFLAVISFSGCLQDECKSTRTFISFEPIYRTEAQIRQDITTEGARELKNPGKIYVYGDYLLINEQREGIHIINNKDPRNPVNISFINIPGNVDMAVQNNILYADNYIDLITIDIQDPSAPNILSRTQNVFPSIYNDPSRGYLVYYNETETRQEMPCNSQTGGWFWQENRVLVAVDALGSFASANQGNVSGASVSGIGGSMARFTLSSNYLYTVDNNNLHVFDLSSPAFPKMANTVNFSWGIETIFPYEKNLFIGSQSGMFIFETSNPLEPKLLAAFEHARACDPVFVEDDLAYVTLRDGTPCAGYNNQLEIVDVSNLLSPKLLKIHPMHHPYGLSVVNKTVYLCEDDAGLKVLDAKDYNKLNELSRLDHFTAYDVITLPSNNLALVIGKDGLYQFDISDPAKLKELSKIPVVK